MTSSAIEPAADAQPPDQRQNSDLTERAVGAYHRAWAAMALSFPTGRVSVEAGIARLRTGLPVAPFNGIWGTTKDVDERELLAAVDEFATGDLPWNLQLRPDYPGRLDAAFGERGLVRTEQIPFMVLTDRTSLAADGVTLRTMNTFADTEAAIRLLEQGFGMPPELTRHGFPLRMFFLPGATTWIATAEGVDVSTALGITDGDLCGVFNVATPPEHRGRGHGGRATAQAVLASTAGAAYLQASSLGRPVYERLGFSTVELWQQWMPAQFVQGPA